VTRVNPILAAGRTAAESLMQDACTITRVTGQTLNDTTGAWTDTVTTVYTGKCRLQVRAQAVAALPQAGEREVVAFMAELQLPMSAVPQVGDKATITASTHDAALVGRVFRVRELMHKTHLTARRTIVQEEQN
jgi:hypothetical protein